MAASPPIKAKRELCNEQSKSAKQVMKDRQRESDKLLLVWKSSARSHPQLQK